METRWWMWRKRKLRAGRNYWLLCIFQSPSWVKQNKKRSPNWNVLCRSGFKQSCWWSFSEVALYQWGEVLHQPPWVWQSPIKKVNSLKLAGTIKKPARWMIILMCISHTFESDSAPDSSSTLSLTNPQAVFTPNLLKMSFPGTIKKHLTLKGFCQVLFWEK